jgi:hypothetical protein
MAYSTPNIDDPEVQVLWDRACKALCLAGARLLGADDSKLYGILSPFPKTCWDITLHRGVNETWWVEARFLARDAGVVQFRMFNPWGQNEENTLVIDPQWEQEPKGPTT